MQVIRSWPDPLPPGRNYVVDDAQRLVNTDYDYRGLTGIGDDVIHLDWDTAVSRSDLMLFARLAREHPDRVLVAPQPLEPGHRRGITEQVWNCRVYTNEGQGTRWVRTGEPIAHLFGFGMVYLPLETMREFDATFRPDLDAGRVKFDDTGFAGWYFRQRGGAEIAWPVRPVHVHYRISEVPL
jgi:hypothetical protein